MSIFLVMLIVVIVFSAVHILEILSFFSRAAGARSDSKTFGYALQRSVAMFTRVFTMALLPALGWLVDSNISRSLYLQMVSLALLGASAGGVLVFYCRERIIGAFIMLIKNYHTNGNLLLLLFKYPLFLVYHKSNERTNCLTLNSFLRNEFFWAGSFVFYVYAISVLMSFYAGLVFYEYRATLSQLSGLSNALATLILTLYIEPKISVLIDRETETADYELQALMAGRIFGVLVYSQLTLLIIWSFTS